MTTEDLTESHRRVVSICSALSDATMLERSQVLVWLQKLVEAEKSCLALGEATNLERSQVYAWLHKLAEAEKGGPELPSPRHIYRCVQIPGFPGHNGQSSETMAQQYVRNLGYSAKYARAFVQGKLLEMDEYDAHTLTMSGFQLAIASVEV